MPGKQTALSADCWPDRLIGDLPNIYLYASNNPSEGMIAKRRSAATLISYLTPPLSNAGLYRGLIDLKASLERWRGLTPEEMDGERTRLAELIQAQASELDLASSEPVWKGDADGQIKALGDAVLELEYTLIPHGLHITGEPATASVRIDMLLASAEALGFVPERASIEALVDGRSPDDVLAAGGMEATEDALAAIRKLEDMNRLLAEDHELPALIRALEPVGHIVWAKDYASRTRYVHYRHEQAYVLAKGSPKMPEQPIDDIQPWVYSGNQDHPTQKAVKILTPLIEAFSQPGQLVLDPFAGSGSTLVAAALNDRRYLGIELERDYCRVARERLANMQRRLPHADGVGAAHGQGDPELPPLDVDGFIRWLREHDHEGVARFVERTRAQYGL
jgi:hypothetical protein